MSLGRAFARIARVVTCLAFVPSVLLAAPAAKKARPVFTSGVASGDVTPTSAILWTRVDRDAGLTVEVWKNPALIGPKAFKKQIPHVSAAHDFTVKVDATGLDPGTAYYFRFRQAEGDPADAAKSDIGSFRTAPDPSTPADVRATYTGDADGTRLPNGTPSFNDFPVLNAARLEGSDFFVFNGDTIYADSSFRTTGPATTLAEYQAAHRENRGYANLRSLLAATSVYATMDDHEVVNNYNAQTVDPARFAAGRRAFLDYYPIREEGLLQDPSCAGAPLYRKFRWGSEVEVFLLDERSCRSADAAAVCHGDLAPTIPGPIRTMPPFNALLPPAPPAGCLETIYSPARTLLGPVQLAQFRADLGASTAKWKLVVSEEPIQQFHVLPYDRWEGYANERNALLTFIRDNAITGVKFLTTDVHATLLNQVALERFAAPARIADELVTGPIAAPTQQAEVLAFGGATALAAYNGVLSLDGVDCRNLNTNSYALVEVGAMAGTIALTSKDQNGAAIKDGLNPATTCRAADSAPSPDYEVLDGHVGPALYRLVRPTNWNGDLVLYAHGYVFPEAPVALPAEANVLVGLLAPQGYALAYSSFSENGWAIQDGAERTQQLIGIFKSKFGKPARVYVAGASMGGLVTIKLAETHPNTYAGTLPACAVAGGTRVNFEYHAHARALFDFFYPGVLPGNAAEVPPATDVTADIVLPAVAAMTANPTPVSYMAAIDQTPFPFATPDELVQSIVTALGAHVGDLNDVLLTKGKPYFDNQETVYSSALLPPALLAAINAGVDRFAAKPGALNGFEKNYEPTGEIRAPMLLLRDARDPVVPGFNQMSYGAAVAAAGTDDLLVQRAVPAYGHCVFTPAELGTAFADLVKWVELGIKP